MYVIYKSTRLPTDISYSGPTWDSAGIRHRYRAQYDNLNLVEEIVKILNDYNPIGFKISSL